MSDREPKETTTHEGGTSESSPAVPPSTVTPAGTADEAGEAVPSKRRGGRKPEGSRLYKDPRSGNWLWRRRDPRTRRRKLRSTGTPHHDIAVRIAAEYEREFELEIGGVRTYDRHKIALLPLVKLWIASLDCGEITKKTLEMQVLRALALLGIATAADLEDLSRLTDRLLKLERQAGSSEGFGRATLIRGFQKPLRQFVKWLASNRRHLPSNSLAEWALLSTSSRARAATTTRRRAKRRAVEADEMAEALAAADVLDRWNERAHPTRVVFLTLLITGARVGALTEADVSALDEKKQRIDLGSGCPRKPRGEAALDDATLGELLAYVKQRKSGPLLRSSKGERLDPHNLRGVWRETFGLGLVRLLWPTGEPRDDETMILVRRSLASGRIHIGEGGNPHKLIKTTRDARATRVAEIERIVVAIGDEWRRRMPGVDIHSLRTTHQSWAESAGVHPLLIDKQLGHVTPGGGAALEAARSLLVSGTGRRHYVDMSLQMISAHASANAVRRILDDAIKTGRRAARRNTPNRRKKT
ncbi:MAG: hypothetical protein M9894_09855 [Planctomycetes bacterium]|nr:hypothetical protein [Planctomycetota bacterium]